MPILRAMLTNHLAHGSVQDISLRAFDTGGGSGGGNGTGAGGGQGGGSGMGAGSGTGDGAGSGSGSVIKIDPNATYDFGDGKPVKWSEAVDREGGRFYSAERYQRGVSYLQDYAGKLEASRADLQARWDKYHAGQGARPKQAEPAQQTDPLEDIRDMPVVDGRAAHRIATYLREQGLAPIAQVVAQMAQRLQKLEGGYGKLSQTSNSLAEQNQSQEFESYITDTFSRVGPIKGLPEGATLDPKSEFLRELAKDIYLSHQPDSWKAGQFEKALNQRLEGLIKFYSGAQTAALEAAKQKRHQWINPARGNTRGTGQAPYVHRKGSELAHMWFQGQEGQAT